MRLILVEWNSRSLGCARDDKGEGDASMESGCWTDRSEVWWRTCDSLLQHAMQRKGLPSPLSSREPVTFSIFRVFCTRNRMFFNPKQNRHPERSAARIYSIIKRLMARSRRTPAMLVGRCSSKLSNHELQAKSKKSQAPSAAEGPAVACPAYAPPLSSWSANATHQNFDPIFNRDTPKIP